MWKTKKIAISQPFFLIFAHLTAICENLWPPTWPPRGVIWTKFFSWNVRKIILGTLHKIQRHTKSRFFAIKNLYLHPPPPKFASSRKFAKINVYVTLSIIQSRHKQFTRYYTITCYCNLHRNVFIIMFHNFYINRNYISIFRYFVVWHLIAPRLDNNGITGELYMCMFL